MRKLGLGGLMALVFSMVVGSGIFNIPQNVAEGSGLAGSLLAWVLTAVVMLSLVYTFKVLSVRKPELNGGIYEYARAGFGKYAGFLMAWGYWLCVCFANVAYSVMLNDSFGAFFPHLLRHDWGLLLFGSSLIWIMYLLVSNGLKTAKQLNNLMTVIKLIPLVMIVVLMALLCRWDTVTAEWSGFEGSEDLWKQARDTMMVTLWCFIGIEGAVMMSARAKNPRDVGLAGLLGFMGSWILYVLVSVMAFGVMGRMRLAALQDPSVAYLLLSTTGKAAYWFVIASVIVSVLGSWVSWTMVCAQVPMEAARAGIFPKRFLRLNRHQMPAFGLAVSSIAMNIFLMIVMLADNVYMAALEVTGMMILPAYLFSALYLCRLGLKKSEGMRGTLPVAMLCALSCLWMIYSAGWIMLATSLFYIAGTIFYVRSGQEQNRVAGVRLSTMDSWKHYFTTAELVVFILLCIAAVGSSVAIATGVFKY